MGVVIVDKICLTDMPQHTRAPTSGWYSASSLPSALHTLIKSKKLTSVGWDSVCSKRQYSISGYLQWENFLKTRNYNKNTKTKFS